MIFIYVTCKNKGQALEIGKSLIKKRSVACVNIIKHMTSLSLWPPKTGKVEEAKEVILICKTLESKYDAVEQEILRLHTYENPAIFTIPLSHVYHKYYDWLNKELS